MSFRVNSKAEQRSHNAKKQNKTPKEPITNGKDLATQVPLNSSAQDKKEIIVIDSCFVARLIQFSFHSLTLLVKDDC